ncbi:MAG: hypothetical protein AVO34_09770 [Firmicutes bacterium ML8_F2]|nr:MAG: hypothetical protein AVO34_09770 [Firmicutes bacterium ML8_F2]
MTTLLLKELKWNWRSFRYPAFLLVVLFFALLDPPMMKYMNEILARFAEGVEIVMPDPTPEETFFSYLSDVSQMGILVLIFMVMGSVAREKETGAAGWMLSKPIGRWQYLTAKIIVLFAILIAGLYICSALAYLYTMTLIGKAPLAGSIMATTALVAYTLLLATLTFAFSTVLKSQLAAGGLAVMVFFLSGLLNLVVAETAAADFYPNTLLALMKPLIDGTAAPSAIAVPLTVTLLLILLLFMLAGRRFSRMEL